MQCPKCRYEPTLSELQKKPEDCPACGVNYEQHKRDVELSKQERAQAAAMAAAVPGFQREINADYPGAQAVVIVDFNMSFGAMVRFMVKWALAAIPAAIILFIIFWGAISFMKLM